MVSLLPVNVTVAADDRLGINMVGYASVPHCRFEHDVAPFDEATTTNALFLNGVVQVSNRGSNAYGPPVYASSGKEIKWYTVEVWRSLGVT